MKHTIKFVVSTVAASVVTGDISAKAAITLGAASTVTGDIFAKAAITVGAGSSYKSVLNEEQLQSSLISMHNSGVLAAEQQPLSTPDPLTMVIEAALVLVSGELGGRTILPGAYKTDGSITIAAGTVVTLRGNADSKFLFLSGASIVTGADTTFNLVSDSVGTNGNLPLAENIFFVSAGATTMGANSELQGSILSGAAITLGAASVVTGGLFAKAAITLGAASVVNGDIFAKAAITVGAGSSYKSVLNEAPVQPSVNTADQQPLPTV
jgi:cytoskeletal protein CcmA (bactofilin family)